MDVKKRNSLIGVCLFFVTFVALLLVATFYDLEISKRLCDLKWGEYISNNTFGLVLEAIGESPVYVMAAIALAIFFHNCNRIDAKFFRVILKIGIFVGGVVAWYICFNTIFGYVGEHAGVEPHMDKLYVMIVKGIIAFCGNILLFAAFKNVSEENMAILLKWAFVILLTIALANILTQLIKSPMGRMRFRLMKVIEDEDYSGFTKWYVLNGKRTVSEEYLALGAATDGYKSFPSGHTCAAGTVYCLICLPDLLGRFKFKTAKVLCWILPILYTGLVAVSRIVVGAHYMSDVLVGGTLTFVSMIIFRKLIITGFKKPVIE